MDDPVFTNWYDFGTWANCVHWDEAQGLCLKPTRLVYHDHEIPPTRICSYAHLGDELQRGLEIATPPEKPDLVWVNGQQVPHDWPCTDACACSWTPPAPCPAPEPQSQAVTTPG